MKRLIQGLLPMFLTVGASTAVLAEPPGKKSCDDPDVYTRLECRQQGIANQLGYTSDVVFAEDIPTPLTDRIEPARLALIRDGANKADRAALKNDAKMFKRLAKANSQASKGQELGHLVPLNSAYDVIPTPDGDGICDYEQGDSTAKCAAIEVDQNGDPLVFAVNDSRTNRGV